MLRRVLNRTGLNDVGDTIVEVLIAIALLSLVLGIAYNLALKDASNTQLTQERSEALQLTQSQIEFLRQNASSDQSDFNSSGSCFNYSNGNYTTSCSGKYDGNVIYYTNIVEPPNTTDLYQVSVSWDPISSGYQYNVTLYYQL